MEEIKRAKEFIRELNDIEELIFDSVMELSSGCPIWVAKKKIIGIEKNCKLIKLSPSFLTENPYIKNIHIEDWMIANIYLNNYAYYEEGKTSVYDSRKRDIKSLTTIYEYCYFSEDVRYPTIGTVFPLTKWMGVEPGEINSFAPFIKEAQGKVLLMGCGLGYVAYMLSLKEEVEEVTIVEINPYIKKMFETYLKPQMNSKINIVLDDAIRFLEEENISIYQYCSIDIWHDSKDMFPLYLKCLLLEEKHPETKFHYWLEEELHKGLEATWIKMLYNVLDSEDKQLKKEIFTDILKMQNMETVEDIKSFILAPKRPLIKNWVLQNPQEAYNNEGLVKSLLNTRK